MAEEDLTFTQKRTLQRIKDTIASGFNIHFASWNSPTVRAIVRKGYLKLNEETRLLELTEKGIAPIVFK